MKSNVQLITCDDKRAHLANVIVPAWLPGVDENHLSKRQRHAQAGIPAFFRRRARRDACKKISRFYASPRRQSPNIVGETRRRLALRPTRRDAWRRARQ